MDGSSKEGEGGEGGEGGRMERRDQYNLLQDISIEAEVEPYTLSPTLLVGGGQGAKSRVIRLSRSIPRGDLGDKDTHTQFPSRSTETGIPFHR